MKKHKLFFIVTLALLLALSGCSRDTEKVSPEVKTTPEVTITPTEVVLPAEEIIPKEEVQKIGYNVDELKVLSEELTTQVLDGDCSGVNSYFEDNIKATYTAEFLEDGIKNAVAPLGSFVSIESSQTQETDDTIFVAVVLRYENNGLQLLYGYNKDIQLTTFRYSYVTLNEDNSNVESELFKEVDITVGTGDYLMDGIMTIPSGVEKPPVVILVQGSGQSDMDETVGACSNKPFRDIAHGLAQKGIASIRYNKRYYQYKDNISEEITVNNEILDDVGAAIDLAMKSDVLDTTKIYVVGHSQGGMLCPKIATDHPELAGIIALAGSPRHLADIIYDQTAFFLEKDETLSESEIEQYLEMTKSNVEQAKNLSDDNLASPLLGVTGYYWKSLNGIDTKELVTKLTLPMLFLQGSEDFQVYADVDFAEWKTLLDGHENAEFIEYEGLNHLFMPTTGIMDVSDYDYKNNVDQKVILDMADWILKTK